MRLCARADEANEGRKEGQSTELRVFGITLEHGADSLAKQTRGITSVKSVHIVQVRSLFGIVRQRTWFVTGN